MWFTRFPEGVRGIIYSYLRHPCASILANSELCLCLKYVYMQYLPLRIHNSLRPSTLGSVYYGKTQRIKLSIGEQNRMKRINGFRI